MRDGARYRRYVAWTIVSFVFLLLALEIGDRAVFVPMSGIESRISHEYAEARSIRRDDSGPPTILIVGNSLLLQGVDYPELRRALEPRARVVRFVIESTVFYDWYFGIRRLLAEGSRPDVIVLCLSAPQLVSAAIRGDFSSYYLFQAADLPRAKRDLGYDWTQASGLWVAHYSRFYADRNNVRSFILQQIAPAYSQLAHDLVTRPAAARPEAEIEQETARRLQRLSASVAEYPVRLAILVPPGASNEGPVARAGEATATRVLIPIRTDAVPPELYSDGVHLNAGGATLFTEALTAELLKLVGERVGPQR